MKLQTSAGRINSGGAGTDYADYVGTTTAITVNLATGTASGGAGNDTLSQIENLRGGSGDDRLSGDSLANTLKGEIGNDTLSGGDGTRLSAVGVIRTERQRGRYARVEILDAEAVSLLRPADTDRAVR